MRVVAQLAEFWKNFGPDKHAACGQRPAWHDSVRSLALAKFTGSLSMVTTRHPGSHSSTLPVEMLPVGEDPARQFCFNHFDFPPRGRGDAKIIEYEYLADDSLSLFGSSRVRSISPPPDRGVRVDPCYFFLFFLLEFISKFNCIKKILAKCSSYTCRLMRFDTIPKMISLQFIIKRVRII